jgi:hypothetical protein
MRTVILDNNITNSDWTKANAFDFPDVKTVEDFENLFNIPKKEPARSEKLARLAVLPWVRVAPAPVRELLEGFQKQSLVKLLKASFGGDRSEAGRYAANIRWQGNVKGDKRFRSRKENRWGRYDAGVAVTRFGGNNFFIERKWQIDKMPALKDISTEVLLRLASNYDPETSVVQGVPYVSIDSLETVERSRQRNTNELKREDTPTDDRTAIVHHIVAGIFGNWESDADRKPAIQAKRAVADVFGLSDSKEVPTYTNQGLVAPLPSEDYEALKAVLKAVYQRTQLHLADTGLSEDSTVNLYRGTREVGEKNYGKTINYRAAALTSFTSDPQVANDWTRLNAVLTAKTPRTKVFFINNVFLQGGNMAEEQEVILLGGEMDVKVSARKRKDDEE